MAGMKTVRIHFTDLNRSFGIVDIYVLHRRPMPISVDVVECEVNKPTPFNPTFYSHKSKRAGLRYEFGVALDGDTSTDLRIFRARIKGFAMNIVCILIE